LCNEPTDVTRTGSDRTTSMTDAKHRIMMIHKLRELATGDVATFRMSEII